MWRQVKPINAGPMTMEPCFPFFATLYLKFIIFLVDKGMYLLWVIKFSWILLKFWSTCLENLYKIYSKALNFFIQYENYNVMVDENHPFSKIKNFHYPM